MNRLRDQILQSILYGSRTKQQQIGSLFDFLNTPMMIIIQRRAIRETVSSMLTSNAAQMRH